MSRIAEETPPARGLILAAGDIDLAEEVVVDGRRKMRIGVATRAILLIFRTEDDQRRALREGRAEFGWPEGCGEVEESSRDTPGGH